MASTSLLLSHLASLCAKLRLQHEEDLEMYFASHTEWKNQYLHQVMIPVETFSVFCLVTSLLLGLGMPRLQTILSVGSVGWIFGILSLVIGEQHPVAAIASFVFSVLVCPCLSFHLVVSHGITRCAAFAFLAWLMASGLQVGVGHWLWELNDPDVVKNQVSLLSLTHSVQIAWSL